MKNYAELGERSAGNEVRLFGLCRVEDLRTTSFLVAGSFKLQMIHVDGGE